MEVTARFSITCFLQTALFLFGTNAQVKKNEVLTSGHTPCQSQYYKWPTCADNPAGYSCHCGPGYFWNTHMCMSTAVNSRLEFPPPPSLASNGTHAYAYTLLLAIQFPVLNSFTASFWIEVANASHPGVIFSYKYALKPDVMLMTSGPTVGIVVNGESVDTGYRLAAETWTYLSLTWSSLGGLWQFYVDGRLWMAGEELGVSGPLPLPDGGDFVLGQVASDGALQAESNAGGFALEKAFAGNLSHFNIWDYVMSEDDIRLAFDDCTYTHCGNAVEWISFRSGTRGTARLRWPSGVPGSENCFSEEQSERTCEIYCGVVQGVQCKESTRDNILWQRSPVGTTLTLPCPGYQAIRAYQVAAAHLDTNHTAFDDRKESDIHVHPDDGIPYARRTCLSTNDNDADWSSPETSQCLSAFFKQLIEELAGSTSNEEDDEQREYTWLRALENYTQHESLTNPIDLTAAVTVLKQIVDRRKARLRQQTFFDRPESNLKLVDNFQKFNGKPWGSANFSDLFMRAVSHLLTEKNRAGWNTTIPLAQEAARLMLAVDDFGSLIAEGFKQMIKSGKMAMNEARYRWAEDGVGIKVQVLSKTQFRGLKFPDVSDQRALGMSPNAAVLNLPSGLFENSDSRIDQISVIAVRYDKVSQLLPNPATFRTMDDNVNSALMSVSFRDEIGLLKSLNVSFTIEFALIENDNVSNAACFSSELKSNGPDVRWNPVVRSVLEPIAQAIKCKYTGSGVFGVTTDMFDLSWRKPEVVLELLSVPAYVGGGISVLLCLLTLGLLIYIRTSSCTSLLHKHLALSVALGNLSFMIGVGLIQNQAVCRTFSVAFHYFFLTDFAWLMNEALNLYYVVTYTAHNQASQASSSGVRYYIIGWAFPAIAVGIIVGLYYDQYFAPDMCWVDWSMIWFFVGPPLAIICVTLLVMTFAAKESTEMSYTKNEAANKLTEYHSRAVWTQIVLLTMTWAFGMAMLRFRGSVFKWVYMIFGCMQGAFFFVFYFLLNEEVRTVIKGKEIRKELGWEVTGVDDSMLFDCNDEAIPLTLKEKKDKESDSGKRSSKLRGCVSGGSGSRRPQSAATAAMTGEVHATLADAEEELDDLMVTSV